MSKEIGNIIISRRVLTDKVIKMIDDLGWEYDRMSSSGQETYDKLTDILEITDE